MVKVIGFKKLKSGSKKYEITFEKNGKKYIRKFGAAGMSDFTKHKDKSRRERYISRHKKDLRTGDPMRPGYLSMYILWNKPTVKASLADYKRRLNVYNRTGKFPKGITGSKKLSFGTVEKFRGSLLERLPEDTQDLINQQASAMTIQPIAKKMDAKRSLIDALKVRAYQRYKEYGRRYVYFIQQLWTNLDPENEFTAKWFTRAAKVLNKNDFDFKTRNFWWKVMENNLEVLVEMTEDGTEDPREYLDEPNRTYYIDTERAIIEILSKVGYRVSLSPTSPYYYASDDGFGWDPSAALNWWKSKRTNFGTIIPFDETSLNVLPSEIQNLIQRDVSASDIQRIQRGRNIRKVPSNMMTKKFLKKLLWKMNAQYESPEYATEMMQPGGEPWLVLEPWKSETSQWLFYAAEILTAKDFDEDDLWYNCLEHVVDLFVDEDPDSRYQYLNQETRINLMTSAENVEEILKKLGHYIDTDEPQWYNRALSWLQEEYSTGNAFGKKYSTPDNVVNKALYSRIKAKIKRSIKGRRWGAYDSGRLVREYKAKGGKYRGGKGKSNLGRWYKEKWVDACAWPKKKPCGRKTKEKIAYCRPSKKVDSKTPKLVQKLTKSQIKSRCAKKKKSPMKRVTRFGRATNDEVVPYGRAGEWVIHCNYYDWGAHSTLRYKPLAGPIGSKDDYSYHYGVFNDGKVKLWATDKAKNTVLNPVLKQYLINYFNTRCLNQKLTKQNTQDFYNIDQYGTMTFGNAKSVDFYKQLMKTNSDPHEVTKILRHQLQLRCGKTGNKICDNYLTALFLNIFHTIKKQMPKSYRRKQIINMIKPIENQFRHSTGYTFTELPIKKSDYPKLRVLLGLMQDEVLDYTKDVAHLASAVLAYIS